MAKSESQKKAVKLSHSAAANKVVAEMPDKIALQQLAIRCDQLVVQSGGQSSPATAQERVRRSLLTLEAAGLVKLTRPTDITVERIKR